MSDDKLRLFNQLSWKIVEAKYRYHVLDNPELSDYDYDMLEKQYEGLARELKLPAYSSDLAGFDDKRPSSWLVAGKLQKPKKKQRTYNFQVGDAIKRKDKPGMTWPFAPAGYQCEVLDIVDGILRVEFLDGVVRPSHPVYWIKVG